MKMRLYMAWRTVCHNRRQAVAVLLLSACAMALLLSASFLGNGLRSGLIAAVEPFDLLVGNGGSYQMVVNTVFLQDYPAGNVSYDLVKKLRADRRVAAAIPLAFGDNCRGYRMVGTERGLFTQPAGSGSAGAWLRLDRGDLFAESGREAVVGARAARELGLRLGDEIVSSHGLIATGDGERHSPFRVCGILQPCNGPYDRAIFVPIQAVWDAHDHGHGENGGEHEASAEEHTDEERDDRRQGFGSMANASLAEAEHDDESSHGSHRETTAIMVKPSGYAEAYQLFADFQREKRAEMVFPSQVVVRLLAILGQAEWVFKAVGIAAGLLAAAIVALVLYWSACERREEMRILGLLGAEKWDRLLLVLTEGMLAILPGIAVGYFTGRILLSGLGGMIGERTGLGVTAGVSPLDAGLAGCLIAAGLLGGLWGGWRAMRGDY